MKNKGLIYTLGLCLFLSISTYFYFINNKGFFVKFINHPDISWNQLNNKIIIIHYWATWCTPCIEEMPEWNEFYKKYKAKVNILGFNADGLSDREQKDILKKYHIQFLALQNDILPQLNITPLTAIPATIIIDSKKHYQKIIYGQSALSFIKTHLVLLR